MSPEMLASDRIALIRISLDDVKPAIWRRVEVPLGTDLLKFHAVIQAVMPFDDRHSFRFDVMQEGKLRQFGKLDPDDADWLDIRDAVTVTLGELITAGTNRMLYTYDFGDEWRHTITIDATAVAHPARTYPRFVEGARRAPPEDVGGLPGFEAFLQAMARPRHRDSRDLVAWYGGVFDPTDINLPLIKTRIGNLGDRKNQ